MHSSCERRLSRDDVREKVTVVLNSISSFEFAGTFLPWAPHPDLVIIEPGPIRVRSHSTKCFPHLCQLSPYTDVGSPGVMFKLLVSAPFDQLRLLNLGDPRGPGELIPDVPSPKTFSFGHELFVFHFQGSGSVRQRHRVHLGTRLSTPICIVQDIKASCGPSDTSPITTVTSSHVNSQW